MRYLLNKSIFKVTSLFLGGVIFLTGCGNSSKETAASLSPLKRTEFVLGTTATLSLYDHQSEELLDAAFDELYKLENTLSINKTGTLIDQINENAGIAPVKVDEDTFKLIEKGLSYSELTHSAFDITIGPIVKLWNIGFPEARVPSQAEIDEKLTLVNYKWVQMDPANDTIYLEKKGMLLDLGGIGKGYAADAVAQLLRESGAQHAIINLGGNVYTLGNKPGDQLWTIGVQDPFNPRGNTIGTLKVENKSIVTSGIYERYLETADGKKYHHILDPATGYPYANEIAGVTIISDTSTDGDALSTAAFAMGIQDGLAFIESLEGIDAIFVTTDHKVYITSGMKENFHLKNEAFTLES